MSFLYPINLKVENRLCIIVGGGKVALRKTKALCSCGAMVRVISPVLLPELKNLAVSGALEWFERSFSEGDLDGAYLVFAATDQREVQEQILSEAERYQVLVNSADDPVASNFHVPAHFRRGRLLVSVSTGGASPALAGKIRERLEGVVDPRYEAVGELLALVREQVLQMDKDHGHHRHIFNGLLQNGIVELIFQEKWFEVQMLLLQELPKEVDSVEIIRQFWEKFEKQD